MIIGSKITDNNFLYDHGVEAISAALTLLALIVSLSSFLYTNRKLKKDEQNKNRKTLQMIDLVTKKEQNNIRNYIIMLERKKDVLSRGEYEVISPVGMRLFVQNKKAFIISERANYINENKLGNELENYLELIKVQLNNNHVNLSLDSLEKITDKINELNNAINQYERISDMGEIYNTILIDSRLPIESQNEIKKLYKEYENFVELLRGISLNINLR